MAEGVTPESGVWSLEESGGIWSLESGVWSLESPGVWSLEFGVTPESGG